MQRHLLFMLAILMQQLCGYSQLQKKPARDTLVNILAAVIAKDQKAFVQHALSKAAIKTYLQIKSNVPELSNEQEEKLDDFIDRAYPDYIKEVKENYNKIIKNEPAINWAEVSVDSVQLTENKDKKTISGCIFMKNRQNIVFYKMNFTNLVYTTDGYFLEKLYTPHLYVGPKNRLLTADIKNTYIDSCVQRTKWEIGMMQYKDNGEAMYGKCIPCFCEKQYVSETDQTDGVTPVKNFISGPSHPYGITRKNNQEKKN